MKLFQVLRVWSVEQSARTCHQHIINRYAEDLSSFRRGYPMNSIIYLVGLVVIVLFILSLLGLR
ncbi:hypothetical protein EXN68_17305 [Rhizobium rhizogenes]|uniref:Uncharacterized protein n=1 Tax=Rhizobium rhizogenes TaxID=359 RepID=A0A546XEV1_RHIRH|nr:hypothetical protein EXN68_17305 [Rhizobium rhizogenes]